MNIIEVQNLVDEYGKIPEDKKKEFILKNIVVKQFYIGLKEKRDLIQNIIFDNKLRLNSSVDRYINYIFILFSSYLNINVDFSKKYDEYDSLNKVGLIEILLNIVPTKERNEFTTVMNMELDDVKGK